MNCEYSDIARHNWRALRNCIVVLLIDLLILGMAIS